MDAALRARHDLALDALADAMDSIRYRRLVDSLVALSVEPRLTRTARMPAAELLPRLVAREWHRLADGSRGVPGAGFLDRNGDDTEWHEVRKRTKRVRYAAEVAAFAVGAPAVDLSLALAAAADVLGAHQDAAIAADTWLAIATGAWRGAAALMPAPADPTSARPAAAMPASNRPTTAMPPDQHRLAVTAGRLFERERAAVTAARLAFPALWADADRERVTGWLR